jgi:uncharacterized protein
LFVTTLYDIPELAARRRGGAIVRIPPGVDVPLTPRVRNLIDTPAFRRLSKISQLGLVCRVYPAANHTRQEHSLGVFLAAIEYLDRLASNERFAAAFSPSDASVLLAAALLHDVGHWPFGHPIEDLRLPNVPRHEQLARRAIVSGEVADVLRQDWGLDPAEVADVLAGLTNGSPARKISQSILSGPIDVDKTDYLMRDSLHAGVPYGQNFDRRRLVASLCLNNAGDGLAITDKGKTAAEMMVFARYVMFSEVYWHHAVRAATAMLQRAFFLLREMLDLEQLFAMSEQPMIDAMLAAARPPERELFDGLFGPRRSLYKRLRQYSHFEEPDMYRRLARRPYQDLLDASHKIAAAVGQRLGQLIADHEVLVDAPPTEREVDFNIEVYFPKQNVYRPLGEISPMVRALAREQFDDYVKRVRIFVHPRIADAARKIPDLPKQLARALEMP